MTCCNNHLPNLSACTAGDSDKRKFIENLLTVSKDKFLKFITANKVDIVSIAIYSTPYRPRSFSAQYDWANCKVEYQSYNLKGDYYLKLTRSQLKKLYEKGA